MLTKQQAIEIGTKLGIDFNKLNPDEFHYGMNVELEHGKSNPMVNVTNDDLIMTGKIALAHLLEGPDYYQRLRIMESQMEKKYEKYTDQDKYQMIMKNNTNSNNTNSNNTNFTDLNLTDPNLTDPNFSEYTDSDLNFQIFGLLGITVAYFAKLFL